MAESEEDMKIWYIWGTGLERLEIKANSFDEALKEARQINPNYNTGQVKGYEEHNQYFINSRNGL